MSKYIRKTEKYPKIFDTHYMLLTYARKRARNTGLMFYLYQIQGKNLYFASTKEGYKNVVEIGFTSVQKSILFEKTIEHKKGYRITVFST